MSDHLQSLLPTNDDEGLVVSTELLVLSVQVALQKAMTKHGVTNAELATRLGMSVARVSQIFSEKGPNLTLKTIARVASALGENFEFLPSGTSMQKNAGERTPPITAPAWHENRAANDHDVPVRRRARRGSEATFPNNRIWANGFLERRQAA